MNESIIIILLYLIIFIFCLLVAALYVFIRKNISLKEEIILKDRAFRALFAREMRLRNMFDNHSSIMSVVDPGTGNIITANPAAGKFYGYKVDQMKGMKISEIVLLDEDQIMSLMQRAAGRESDFLIIQNRLATGDIRTVEIHSSPIIVDEKPLLFLIIHDITDRELAENALRESETLQSVLLENLPAGVVIVDPDTRVLERVNNYAAELFGASMADITGHQCHTFLCPACEGACPVLDLGKTVDNAEREMLRADGVLIPILKTIKKIQINGRDKLLECFVDISELKKAESDAEIMREKAEAANRAKSEFLASMSHEIRTPMNGVISMTNLLLETELDKKQNHYARIIRSSGEALLSLINDILDFSKIEAYKLDLEILDFHLTRTMYDTVELMRVRAEEKGLTLKSSVDPGIPQYLRGDPGRLRQIVLNLLSNAVKFTVKGEIELQVVMEKEIEQWVRLRFSVIDTGIGIPDDKKENIFLPFTQADSSVTRKYGGTGLGLTISKQLAEMMGGAIGVTGEAGKGSTFWFTAIFEKQGEGQILPAAEPVTDIRGYAAMTASKNAHILLAEDNYTNQIVTSEMLKQMGYNKVDIAADGLEVLSALESINYDLVLMDCHMPEMDGFETTRRIRSTDSGVLNHEIPVVAMTALAMKRDRDEAADSGMNDYICKPVELYDLVKMIEKWLPGKADDLTKTDGINNTVNNNMPDETGKPEFYRRVFNRDSFLSRLMNNKQLAENISRAFLIDMPAQIERLSALIESGDCSGAGHQAHRMRGASANVSGEVMSDVASRMEEYGFAGNFEALKDLFPVFLMEFNLLKEAINKNVLSGEQAADESNIQQ